MADLVWIIAMASGVTCIATGVLAWMKVPKTMPTTLFLFAMITTFLTMMTSRIGMNIGEQDPDLANLGAKIFVTLGLLATAFMWELTLVFPVDRKISFMPPNLIGGVMVFAAIGSVIAGSFAQLDFHTRIGTVTLDQPTGAMLVSAFAIMIGLATTITLLSRRNATNEAKHSSTIYLIGLWMVAVSGEAWALDLARGHMHAPGIDLLPQSALIAGVTLAAVLYALSIARGTMTIGISPLTERAASAAKSKYKLLHRRVYLVEEPKPDFSFNLFADILKGRCFDCEDDESFTCESLDCNACGLPCPCRKCTKYESRTQGLIVTRQFPKDVRSRYYLQTTPIIWLTTVAGKDNMDPAKLSLLTDLLVNSMEKSRNGVVLLDGIEYLITSNDFQRVLKAVDRLTETAMTSATRLVVSIDPRAFDERDLAMLERDREVVRPQAGEPWKVMPERI